MPETDSKQLAWLWFAPLVALVLSRWSLLLGAPAVFIAAPAAVALDRPLPPLLQLGCILSTAVLLPWITPLALIATVLFTLLPALLHPASTANRWDRYAQFWLKCAIFVSGLAVASISGILLGLCCSLFKPKERGNLNHYTGRVLRYVTAPYLGLTYTLTTENTSAASPCILGIPAPPMIPLANHQSALDILHIATHWPKRLVIMAKDTMRWYPFMGQFMWLAETVFVKRGDKQVGVVNEAAASAKARGVSIFLFPEGTRSHSREPSLLPFKKGAFFMALRAGVPIVPVVMSHYEHLYNSRDWRFLDGHVRIHVMKPISVKSDSDVEDCMKQCWETMHSCLLRITQEAKQHGDTASVLQMKE